MEDNISNVREWGITVELSLGFLEGTPMTYLSRDGLMDGSLVPQQFIVQVTSWIFFF